jgi:hypothetical protein
MSYIQDLINQGYGGYQGWNDEAAVRADFQATGGAGKKTSGGGSSGGSSAAATVDPIELAKKYQQFQIEANQPAIQQLQSSIPGVQQKFAAERQSLEAEKNPLEQRYQSLLADVTKQTSIATSREAGRRGVSTESGMYDEWLAERIEPQTQQLGLSKESDLRNLTNLISQLTSGETEAVGGIQSQIAQLMAGNAPSSISSAQNWQQILEQARQFDAGQEMDKFKYTQPTTTIQDIGGRAVKLTVDSSGNIVSREDLGASTSGGGSSSGLSSDVLRILLGENGGGGGQTEAMPTYSLGQYQSGESEGGQWAWNGTNWVPIVD